MGEMTLAYYNVLYGGFNYSISGFPTTSGSGIVMSKQNEFAVCAASAHPEEAMKFLRILFDSEEAGKYLWKFFDLPASAELFENRMKDYNNNPNEVNVYDHDTASVGYVHYGEDSDSRFKTTEEYLEFYPNREIVDIKNDEVGYFTETMLNCKVSLPDDDRIIEIVTDELVPFLAGQDTAANTANRINSRVGIYLAEQYS